MTEVLEKVDKNFPGLQILCENRPFSRPTCLKTCDVKGDRHPYSHLKGGSPWELYIEIAKLNLCTNSTYSIQLFGKVHCNNCMIP